MVDQLRKEKVSKKIARLIVRDTAFRRLPPGAPLPREDEMAHLYGVGRGSLREALRLLEMHGLIIIRPGAGGGPTVGSPDGTEFGQMMTMFLQAKGSRFADVMDAHRRLETMAAVMAAERVASGAVSSADVEALSTVTADGFGEEVSDDEILSSGAGFHETIRHLAGNDLLTMVGMAVSHIFGERLADIRSGSWGPAERQELEHDHRAIANAIQHGDAEEARRQAEKHWSDRTNKVLERYAGLVDEMVEWR
jgi:GntR family transcriptional repressor for pyruvate dehydrogenase complex